MTRFNVPLETQVISIVDDLPSQFLYRCYRCGTPSLLNQSFGW